jgi:hypothetical protein
MAEGRLKLGPEVNVAAITTGSGVAVPRPSDDVSEGAFQQMVIGFAQMHGWMVAHFRPVRVQRADGTTHWETPVAADGKGFPDLILVRNGCLIAAELKVGKNKLTAEQRRWMEQLDRCQFTSGGWDGKSPVRYTHSALWRPEDWERIQKLLSETK